MLNFRYFFLLALFPIFSSLETNTTFEDFTPTNEWQVVKPNQKLPPGLHIRSNLQTGVTEAKFLDNHTNVQNSDVMLINETKNDTDVNHDTKSITYSKEQLKAMLKNIKNEDRTKKENDYVEINGTRFKTYEQLKEEMKSMKMDFKTDLEIIQELVEELKSNNLNVDRKLNILKDLEYYLHQIDNAQNFIDMDGLSILHSFIDDNELKLKSEAFRCLSSALQGNSKVKVKAIQNGTLSRLLTQLELTNDASLTNQILVAISSITRHFPIAQVAFINGGGMSTMGKIFDHYFKVDDKKITLKIITLISDWLKERNVENSVLDDSSELRKQYSKVNIELILQKESWCTKLGKMFSISSDISIDYYEKVIHSIINIYPICGASFDNNDVMAFLNGANLRISELLLDSDDFYVGDMLKLVEQAKVLVQPGMGKREEL